MNAKTLRKLEHYQSASGKQQSKAKRYKNKKEKKSADGMIKSSYAFSDVVPSTTQELQVLNYVLISNTAHPECESFTLSFYIYIYIYMCVCVVSRNFD